MNTSEQGFRPQYQSGKSVCNVITLFGWIAVLLGFLVAYMGAFASGGSNISVSLMAAAPGLALVVTGFINIALGQIGNATFDNANTNKEILYLMKQSQN